MRTFTILTLLILTLRISAQVPDFFSNNPEWRQSTGCGAGTSCVEEEEYVYYLNGDSTIGDFTYKKVFKHGILEQKWYNSPPIPTSCDSSWTFNHFHALVRQEEARIYIKQWDFPEALLYDFELAVGDTLPITWNQWYEDIVVLSIDSLLVGNHYRKVFNLTVQSSPQLIEGIGHAGGFIEPFPPTLECGHFLICYAVNDTTYYPNYGDPCDLNIGVPPQVKTNKIKTYPNPTTKTVTVEFGNPGVINNVYAFNIEGQKRVLTFEQENQASIKIDVSELRKGLYIIQLNDNEGVIFKLKVLKK